MNDEIALAGRIDTVSQEESSHLEDVEERREGGPNDEMALVDGIDIASQVDSSY